MMEFDSGSFRDRDGRVFRHNGAIYRALSESATADWRALSATKFFPRLMAEGKIIGSKEVAPPVALEPGWSAVLQHDVIPFISYPYEWPFAMLKDAALLQLETLLAAVKEDLILKDATSYNFQWVGSRPVLIDVSSFERMEPGRPWPGYRQFCQLFLNPLFLKAYRDIPYQAWLRGNLEGIDPEDCLKVMSKRDLLRPGVFKHVYLHAKLQSAYGHTKQDVNRTLQSAGFNKELIQSNLRALTKLVQGLEWKRKTSTWSEYADQNSYSAEERKGKESFVEKAADSRRRKLVWDLGCNTGTFSRIAASHSDYVVAMDADPLTIDLLYRELKKSKTETILPLISNVANPGPDQGWKGLERKSLAVRGKPDLVLCLALIHHVVISANIPLREFVEWLASLRSDLIIEFVNKQDPMVKKLLLNKKDIYVDYDQANLEAGLRERFEIRDTLTLASGTRTLYYCEFRG